MGDEIMMVLDRLDRIEGMLGDEYGNTKTANFYGPFAFEIEGEGIIDFISVSCYGDNNGHKKVLLMRVDDESEFKFFESRFASSQHINDSGFTTKIKFQKRLTLRATTFFYDTTISYRLKED